MRLSPLLDSFADELEKIAGAGMTGAMIGGGLGALAGGKRFRVLGGVTGAAAGGLLGAGAGVVKRFAMNESARQRAAAMTPTWEPEGYVPTWQRHYIGNQ